MSWRLWWLAAALSVVLSGCAHVDPWAAQAASDTRADGDWTPTITATGTTLAQPAALHGPDAAVDSDDRYALDTGDRLRIFVYGQPNLSRQYIVDQSGDVSVPLIGRVKARGLTTYALERSIRSRLGTQYVRDPEVTVDIIQNRPFFILGEVRNAGQFPYVGGMTVRSAVAIAGGYSERADQRIIQITRRNNGVVEKLDVPDDYVVRPGDTLFVYERFL